MRAEGVRRRRTLTGNASSWQKPSFPKINKDGVFGTHTRSLPRSRRRCGANIALDDGLILPHSANPTGSNFRERQVSFLALASRVYSQTLTMPKTAFRGRRHDRPRHKQLALGHPVVAPS